jgi:DNA-binding transcriptional LysR family regulator
MRDFDLQVGCRLLDRNPKGVRPTREGQALARAPRQKIKALPSPLR